MEKRLFILINLFHSVLFGVLFAFVGWLINRNPMDVVTVILQLVVSILVGFLVGMLIPAGKWGDMLAMKIFPRGGIGFAFIRYSVILLVMLVFMCPILTVFIACALGGAPVLAVIPGVYELFVPFYFAGIVTLMLIGRYVVRLAEKCAGK